MKPSFFKLLTAYFKAGFPCIFHYLTGYYCPGCGGTRALIALLHGRILTSLRYNPLTIYFIFLFGYLIFNGIKKRKNNPNVLWLGLFILIVNFIVKNVFLYFGVDLLY
ncbi:MAG: DUF2752 domain-containing protein [Lachnospiraceae bacterium]|nr:DUF2752 domain-containing protein [Lachnospiraceae bacterium]